MNRLLTLMLLLCTLQAALAQAPPSRERELLRRAQAALRELTVERDVLRAELAAQKAMLAQTSAARDVAQAEAASLRAPLQRAQDLSEAQRAELEALRAQHQRESTELQAQAAEREALLRGQLSAAQQERDERTLANRSLSALLERSSTALRDAESRNRELHALSLTVVDRWRRKTPAEALAHSEPVIGIAGVRAEDQAEQWRLRADALARPVLAR